ncbi:DNA-directed DNA polymerase, partial [Tieghemiomyces parasiticus]
MPLPDVTQTVVDLLWPLASEDAAERQTAASSLLTHLIKIQATFDEKRKQDKLPPAEPCSVRSEAEATVLCSPDVLYVFKRLVGGLCSGRKRARQGFSVALTELLVRFPRIAPSFLLDRLDQVVAEYSNTGSESPDCTLGRLFGYLCLIQSGSVALSSCPTSEVTGTVQGLLDLAAKKPTVRESCFEALIMLVHKLADRSVRSPTPGKESKAAKHGKPGDVAAETVAQTLLDHLAASDLHTPDDVALLLALQRRFPGLPYDGAFPTWNTGNILTRSTLSRLVAALSSLTAKNPAPAVAGWLPPVHAVWRELFDIYYPASGSGRAGLDIPWFQSRVSFQELWSATVGHVYFRPRKVPERKHRGLLLLASAVQRVQDEDLSALFTRAARDTLGRAADDAQSPLRQAAIEALEAVVAVAKKRPITAPLLAIQLVRVPGAAVGQTVATLLKSMTADHLHAYLDHLVATFAQPLSAADIAATPQTDADRAALDEATDDRRQWVCQELETLLRSSQLPRDARLFRRITEFFLVYGVFAPAAPLKVSAGLTAPLPAPNPAVSDTISQVCRDHFLGLVNEVKRLLPGIEFSAGDNTQAAARRTPAGDVTVPLQFATHLLNITQALIASGRVALHQALGADEQASYKQAVTLFKSLDPTAATTATPKTKAKAKKSQATAHDPRRPAFRLFVVYQIFRFLDDPEALADELTETVTAIKALTSPSPAKAKLKVTATSESDPLDVLLDTLVSFLSVSSGIHVTLVSEVFVSLIGDLQPSSVELIKEVLTSDPDANDLMDVGTDDDNEEEEADGDLSDSEDSGSDGSSQSDQEESDDSDKDDDDDSDDETEADEELRRQVREALGRAALDDPASDSEQEELLDDNQMEAFDSKLGEIFALRSDLRKNRRSVGQQRLEAKRHMAEFKGRLLKVLEYPLTDPTHSNAAPPASYLRQLLDIATATLGQASGTKDAELALHKKALGLVAGVARVYKRHPPTGFNTETAVTFAEEVSALLAVTLPRSNGHNKYKDRMSQLYKQIAGPLLQAALTAAISSNSTSTVAQATPILLKPVLPLCEGRAATSSEFIVTFSHLPAPLSFPLAQRLLTFADPTRRKVPAPRIAAAYEFA